VGNLLQVMSLMAVPVVILGTIGYLNRRANRRPIEGGLRGDARIPVFARTPATETPATETVSPANQVARGRGGPGGSASQRTGAGRRLSVITPSSLA